MTCHQGWHPENIEEDGITIPYREAKARCKECFPLDIEAEMKKFVYGHQWDPTARMTTKLLFMKVWGSHSHNTAKPDSDIDYLGVYRAPTLDVLGMAPVIGTIDGKNPDYQIHEVRKFCELLLKGNPGIVEMLFTDRLCIESDQWKFLKSLRRNFLTQQTVKQYLGYVEGQLKKHAKGSYLHTSGGQPTEKWAYHMTRLVLDAKRIVLGDEPTVWKEGDERQLLMDIRNGETSPAIAEQFVKLKLAEIENLKPWKLPEQADVAVLNRWLLDVRGWGWGS